jgi:hypothetical protein
VRLGFHSSENVDHDLVGGYKFLEEYSSSIFRVASKTLMTTKATRGHNPEDHDP